MAQTSIIDVHKRVGAAYNDVSTPRQRVFQNHTTQPSLPAKDTNSSSTGSALDLSENAATGISKPVSNILATIYNNSGDSAASECRFESFSSQSIPNIFSPIDLSKPSLFETSDTHPVQPKGLSLSTSRPIHTNKFYNNLLISDQSMPVFTHPYALSWKGCPQNGQECHGGIGIWHTDIEDVVFGPGEPAQWFYNPTHLQHMVLSATELGSGNGLLKRSLSVKDIKSMSATAVLSAQGRKDGQMRSMMEVPLVQGMGWVTAVYQAATPVIGSGVGFLDFKTDGRRRKGGTIKYTARVNTTTPSTWFIYVTPEVPSARIEFLKKDDKTYVSSNIAFWGTVQIAKRSTILSEDVYDKTYGAYAASGTVSGSVEEGGQKGKYTISWTKRGLKEQDLLMFALPHQVDSMVSESRNRISSRLSLRTTTKGMASAVVGGNSITMVESDLPSNIGFIPLSSGQKNGRICSGNQFLNMIFVKQMDGEINFDIESRVAKEDSIYWAGKVRFYQHLISF
jgi:endo-1,3(4)-beta-glucanase